MADAGGGAPAGDANGGGAQQPQQRGLGLLPLLLQGLVVYFMFFRGGGSPPPAGDALNATAVAVPSPTAAPSTAPSFLELMTGMATGKRAVLSELQRYEDSRQAALRAVSDAKALHALWPVNTPLEVHVALSESPLRPAAWVDEPESGDFSWAGAAGEGNATFSGLRRVDTRAGAPGEAAPPLLWRAEGLVYDTGAPTREQHFNITLPASVLANATRVWAHAAFLVRGASASPGSLAFRPERVVYATAPLIKYLSRKPSKVRYNLISGEGAGEAEGDAKKPQKEMRWGIGAVEEVEADAQQASLDSDASVTPLDGSSSSGDGSGDATRYLPYWIPSLHLQLVADGNAYPPKGVPPQLLPVLQVVPSMRGYVPHVHVNTFWTRSQDLLPVNTTAASAASEASADAATDATTTGTTDGTATAVVAGVSAEEQHAATVSLPLTVSYSTQNMMLFMLQSQMESTWELQTTMGVSGEGDADMLKSMLLDTDPWFLGLTMAVSLLHTVFEFLAFRSDIGFWRNARSMEGLSVRSIGLSVFFQAVILLYLFDNETSWLILGSSVVGLVIECWKLRKALGASLEWVPGRTLPRINFGEGNAEDSAYVMSRTKEYDDIAIKHTLLVLYPLVAGMGAYSLLYDRHKSVYSWIISTLVSGVYTFGFVQLVPQLYINYRLKSVAHLPWRPMAFKFLNTIIDDLFAFVIKMPTMHRLAVFRDDVIFLVFLYQRWIYRVDYTRRNEFGVSGMDYEAAKGGGARVSTRSKFDKLPTMLAREAAAIAGTAAR